MTVEQNRADHQYDAPSQGAWRPIETAPKDGTQIIVCGPYSNDIAIVKWNGRSWLCISDGFSVIEAEGDWGTDYRTFEVPSHWMPLPAPPHSGPMTDDPITGTAST